MIKKPGITFFYILIVFLFQVCFFEIQAKTLQLKVTTLNTEWLSCSTNGPDDDELQISNIASVIRTMQPDIIVLQEVGTSSYYATIDTLLSKLGNGWGGSINPAFYDNCGQNLGIIYRKPKIQLVSSTTLSSGISSQGNSYYYNWSSGRYPVTYNINVVDGNTRIPLTVVNLHAKAMSDETSYTRRKGASEALKAILDGSVYNSKSIIITGDFNDYLIDSQCYSCGDSPYKNFMDDTDNYMGLTTGLKNPYYNNPVIDNIVISSELFENHVLNSAKLETSATYNIQNYRYTTSDHTPVSTLFHFQVEGEDPGGCENIAFTESFGSDLGSFIPYSVNGLQNWHWRSVYGAYMSGFADGLNNENEDWLISPVFNLSGMQSASLSFDHALNYAQIEADRLANHTLWISTDYLDGDPKVATWTQLPIAVMASGNSWIYVNSGDIAIPQLFLSDKVRFAFKYLATATTTGTWEIRNLQLNSECNTSAINSEKAANISVSGIAGKIRIKVSEPTHVGVYDIMGRNVYAGVISSEEEINITHSGIYLVRAGGVSYKIVVS